MFVLPAPVPVTPGIGTGAGGSAVMNCAAVVYDNADLTIPGVWDMLPAGTRLVLFNQDDPATNGVYIADGTATLILDPTVPFPSSSGVFINTDASYPDVDSINGPAGPGVSWVIGPGVEPVDLLGSVRDVHVLAGSILIEFEPSNYTADQPYLPFHLQGIDAALVP